jgi:hypothetical protein
MKTLTCLFMASTFFVYACGGNGGGGGDSAGTGTGTTPPPTASTVVLAANDLGMHCMDREFSIFSILPPFNVINAQVIGHDANGSPVLLDDLDVDVRYGVGRPRFSWTRIYGKGP